MSQNATFRKASGDTAFGLSVLTVAAVTNTHLAYKLSALPSASARTLAADVCGDNDVIAGFPYQKCKVGEAVLLQRGGHFEAIASGTIHLNNPLTAGPAGTVRVAVVTTDLFQAFAESEALDGEIVQVRMK